MDFALHFILQVGHFFWTASAFLMQFLQKTWPHFVDVASCNSSIQIGQRNAGAAGGGTVWDNPETWAGGTVWENPGNWGGGIVWHNPGNWGGGAGWDNPWNWSTLLACQTRWHWLEFKFLMIPRSFRVLDNRVER